MTRSAEIKQSFQLYLDDKYIPGVIHPGAERAMIQTLEDHLLEFIEDFQALHDMFYKACNKNQKVDLDDYNKWVSMVNNRKKVTQK